MAEPLDIELHNVDMTFQRGSSELSVLRAIDMAVPRGHLVTIVGPSGCGKSTLLKIIAGLVAPTRGAVSVDGERLKGGMAYVPQASALLPWRTARQNACIGLEVRTEVKQGSTLGAASIEHVDSLLEQWRLNGFEDSYPHELSGGMAQRVALIRSLASQPSLMLCDEPFSAIDFVTRLRLSTLFKRMCKLGGITTILVTHNIEEAIFLGDEVIVLSGRPGRIVATYRPVFSTGGQSALTCRAAPEFTELFNSIWSDLENNQA